MTRLIAQPSKDLPVDPYHLYAIIGDAFNDIFIELDSNDFTTAEQIALILEYYPKKEFISNK